MLVENASAPTDRRVWKEARSLTKAGYRVSIVSPTGDTRDTAAREELEGIAIRRYPFRTAPGGPWSYLVEFGNALVYMRRLVRAIARENPVDIVHLCNPPDVLYLAVRNAHRAGIGVVFDHHDLVPELFEARFGKREGPLYRAGELAERRTLAFADVVLAPNETFRRVAIERGGKSPEDVFVVRMAPDLDKFRPVDVTPSLKRSKRFLLVYAGTMGAQDGVDHALLALRVLADRRDDWHAVLAGDGDAAPAMRRLSTQLGLSGLVDFVGFLGDDELVSLLGSADVCLSPEPSNPLNEASTMIKVVEYMGMGRPVVAFDLAETRFSAGEAALYATANDDTSFADCVERLLDDPELRERMGELGRSRVAGPLSWTESETALLAAYERVLERRRPR